MRWLLMIVVLLGVVAGCGGDNSDDAEAADALTAEDVVLALKDAGIPLADYTVYDQESDPNELLGRPGEYMSKVNFHDKQLEGPSDGEIGTEHGGSVEVFASAEDRAKRHDYVASVLENVGGLVGKEYLYEHENILLRVSYDITPDQVKVYEDVLNDL